MLHNNKVERPDRDKHITLLSPFVSYNENEVSWMQQMISNPRRI